MKDEDHYPCFREWYEASYACADNIMKFLMELSFAKKAQDFWVGDVSNSEMRMFPTIYDSPKAADRITYTYWFLHLIKNTSTHFKRTLIIGPYIYQPELKNLLRLWPVDCRPHSKIKEMKKRKNLIKSIKWKSWNELVLRILLLYVAFSQRTSETYRSLCFVAQEFVRSSDPWFTLARPFSIVHFPIFCGIS